MVSLAVVLVIYFNSEGNLDANAEVFESSTSLVFGNGSTESSLPVAANIAESVMSVLSYEDLKASIERFNRSDATDITLIFNKGIPWSRHNTSIESKDVSRLILKGVLTGDNFSYILQIFLNITNLTIDGSEGKPCSRMAKQVVLPTNTQFSPTSIAILNLIDFLGCQDFYEVLSKSEHITAIQTLQIINTDIGDAKQILSILRSAQKLKWFTIIQSRGCEYLLNSSMMFISETRAFVAELQNTSTTNLRNDFCKIFPSLQKLKISGGNVNFDALKTLVHCSKLTALHISVAVTMNDKFDHPQIWNFISLLKESLVELNFLDLTKCPPPSKLLEICKAISSHRRNTRLSSNCPIKNGVGWIACNVVA